MVLILIFSLRVCEGCERNNKLAPPFFPFSLNFIWFICVGIKVFNFKVEWEENGEDVINNVTNDPEEEGGDDESVWEDIEVEEVPFLD